jgi:hypothetical protein
METGDESIQSEERLRLPARPQPRLLLGPGLPSQGNQNPLSARPNFLKKISAAASWPGSTAWEQRWRTTRNQLLA